MLVRSYLVCLGTATTVLASSFSLATTSAVESTAEFQFVVRYIDLHYGTWIYDVGPVRLVVSTEALDGHARRELCRKPLPNEQTAEWRRVLSTLPIDELAVEYVPVDPEDDGILSYRTYSIRKPGGASRTFRAAPTPPTELVDLCNRVKALVPAGCVSIPELYCGQTK